MICQAIQHVVQADSAYSFLSHRACRLAWNHSFRLCVLSAKMVIVGYGIKRGAFGRAPALPLNSGVGPRQADIFSYESVNIR